MMYSYRSRFVFSVLVILLSLSVAVAALNGTSSSHSEPAQRMFEDFNDAFIRHWKTRTGIQVTIRQAQTGSGVPIRAAVDGLDIVSVALSYDPVALQRNSKFTLPQWQKPVPQSTPYTSTIVFLVRKGNPQSIKDWGDLTRPGIEVVTSDPATSDDARWSYLAAWGYALRQPGGSDASAQRFVGKLLANVKTLERGRRDSAAAFAEQGTGDVLLAWENEAHLLVRNGGADRFEIVVPSMSILAEPAFSVIEEQDSPSGEREVAKAYADYLYTAKAQEIAARHCYRPRDQKVMEKFAWQFPSIELFTVDDVFGSWKEAEEIHFASGGMFEHIWTRLSYQALPDLRSVTRRSRALG